MGSSLSGDFPTETHPLDIDFPRQRAPSPMDSDAPDRDPPVNRMTPASENITLSVADPGFSRGGGVNPPGGA